MNRLKLMVARSNQAAPFPRKFHCLPLKRTPMLAERESTTMLCQKCQQREANCHFCHIVHGEMTTGDWCNECYEANSPEAASWRTAACEYCGGKPQSGGSDVLDLLLHTPNKKPKSTCQPCATEYDRYIHQGMQGIDQAWSQFRQKTFLLALKEDAQNHMRKWIEDCGAH